MADLLRADLHCHSCYSKDSNLSLEKLIEACKKAGVNVVALTDHNEIEGGLRLREMAPHWLTVIVGEEIASVDGDIIGLFLKERIEPRLPIFETIRQIREQGGLVMVPHVVSDAHWTSEYGNATCLIEPFRNVKEFAENLKRGKFEPRRANMLVHAGTAVVKRAKKLRKKLDRTA
jgi:hypothetical protein